MTWDELRHFHRQPAIIAFWRRLLGPLLPWLTPHRRRWLLALGAVVIAVTDPLHRLREGREGLGFTPDTAGAALIIVALFPAVASSTNLDACLQRTAPGAPGPRPDHIFIVVMGSFDSWSRQPPYSDLHLTDRLDALGREGIEVRSYRRGMAR